MQDGIYDAFAEKLATAVKAFKVGEGLKEGTTHGPLIHGAAVDKVQRHVEDAKSKGAKVLLGGEKLDVPGHFFAVSHSRPFFASLSLTRDCLPAHYPYRRSPLRCRRGRDFRCAASLAEL